MLQHTFFLCTELHDPTFVKAFAVQRAKLLQKTLGEKSSPATRESQALLLIISCVGCCNLISAEALGHDYK